MSHSLAQIAADTASSSHTGTRGLLTLEVGVLAGLLRRGKEGLHAALGARTLPAAPPARRGRDGARVRGIRQGAQRARGAEDAQEAREPQGGGPSPPSIQARISSAPGPPPQEPRHARGAHRGGTGVVLHDGARRGARLPRLRAAACPHGPWRRARRRRRLAEPQRRRRTLAVSSHRGGSDERRAAPGRASAASHVAAARQRARGAARRRKGPSRHQAFERARHPRRTGRPPRFRPRCRGLRTLHD